MVPHVQQLMQDCSLCDLHSNHQNFFSTTWSQCLSHRGLGGVGTKKWRLKAWKHTLWARLENHSPHTAGKRISPHEGELLLRF